MAITHVILTAEESPIHNEVRRDFANALALIAEHHGWAGAVTSESFKVISPDSKHWRDAWSVYPASAESRPAMTYEAPRVVRFEDGEVR